MGMIKIFTILISLSLPFLILRPGNSKTTIIKSIFSPNNLNVFLLFLGINAFNQSLSYFAFIPSIVIKFLIYIVFSLSITRPILFLAGYFSSSALIVKLYNISENSALKNFNGNENSFSYIIAALLTYLLIVAAMNSLQSIGFAFYLFEKTSKTFTIRLLLAIILSYKFTRLNAFNKRSIIFIGMLTALALTIGDNISNSIDTKQISLYISIASIIAYILVSKTRKAENNISITSYTSYVIEKIHSAIERVDLVYTCYVKDRQLYFLEDALILYRRGMRLLSGGRSKTIIFKSKDEDTVVKLFSKNDASCEKYFNLIKAKSFIRAFPEYKDNCIMEKNSRTTKITYPYFNGPTLYEFCLDDQNKKEIGNLLSKIINNLDILHEVYSEPNDKINISNSSTKRLEELHLEYLNKKLFLNWALIIEECPQYSDISYDDFKSNALSLINTDSLRYSNTNHGDLTFSNIIVLKDINHNKPIFIDPNPTSQELLPATIVDWSKLMQSCSSQWELANANPELIRYLDDSTIKNYNIPIPANIGEFRYQLLEVLGERGYTVNMLKLHEAVHLSRALPYVKREKYLARYISLRILTLLGFK